MVRLEVRNQNGVGTHSDAVDLAGNAAHTGVVLETRNDRELGVASRSQEFGEAHVLEQATDLLDHALTLLRGEISGSAGKMGRGGGRSRRFWKVRGGLPGPMRQAP